MSLYVILYSQSGDPFEFMAVFSSQSAAEKELVSSVGTRSPLDQYRLIKVECDDRLWGNHTVIPWTAHAMHATEI